MSRESYRATQIVNQLGYEKVDKDIKKKLECAKSSSEIARILSEARRKM